jgi:hypothetical protein
MRSHTERLTAVSLVADTQVVKDDWSTPIYEQDGNPAKAAAETIT